MLNKILVIAIGKDFIQTSIHIITAVSKTVVVTVSFTFTDTYSSIVAYPFLIDSFGFGFTLLNANSNRHFHYYNTNSNLLFNCFLRKRKNFLNFLCDTRKT